jgi:hypothetical protein
MSERYILAFWTPEPNRSLNLPPAEQTQFASYTVVPSQAVCEVVITVTGERYKSQYPRFVIGAIYRRVTARWPNAKPTLKRFRDWLVRGIFQPAVVYYTASAISAFRTSPVSRQPSLNRI